MLNVDTIYQKVLALANKEQRGYITPQDFNLFANYAQKEIFEQYFYDTNIARKNQGNDTVYADIDDMLEEKLQIFDQTDGPNAISNYVGAGGGGINKRVPDYVYRIHRVEYQNKNCEILNTKDFNAVKDGGPLLRPTDNRPVVNIRGGIIRCVIGDNISVTPTGIFYFKIPEKVNWTYVVVNKQALHDANSNTVHFELHPSEETQLVNKILKLAGLSNQQPDIMRAGQGMEMATTQQQPKI
jgi:hypothetical protein